MLLKTNLREIDLSTHTHIMGILNVTPDSFWDGGKFFDKQKAIDHALSLVDAGADIIDIGGESTRPAAPEVKEDEEIRRVLPVIEAIQSRLTVPLSIDTYKSNVAKAAIGAGAEIVNDISGLVFDIQMAAVIASTGAACVITHNSSNREAMHSALSNGDIVHQVHLDLKEKVEKALASSIDKEKIIIDPGIGFGKSVNDDLLLHKMLDKINYYGLPILFASSRKKFIGSLLNIPTEDRLPGTIASCIIALMNGATLLRVHDVKEVVQATRIFDAIRRQ